MAPKHRPEGGLNLRGLFCRRLAFPRTLTSTPGKAGGSANIGCGRQGGAAAAKTPPQTNFVTLWAEQEHDRVLANHLGSSNISTSTLPNRAIEPTTPATPTTARAFHIRVSLCALPTAYPPPRSSDTSPIMSWAGMSTPRCPLGLVCISSLTRRRLQGSRKMSTARRRR